MNVIETSAEGLKRQYKIVIPADQISRKVDTRLKELSQSIRLPGFRPGKVPVGVVRQRYGAGVRAEVLEAAVSESAAEAIRDRGLRAAFQPSIALDRADEGQDLEYTLSVELLPDIEPCDFATLSFERLVVDVQEAEVDRVVGRLADESRPLEPVAEDRPAVNGDVLVVDYAASLDGAPVEGMAGEDLKIELGSGRTYPGLEEQLIGVRAGERRQIPVRVPEAETRKPEVAGKEVLFEITVKSLLERKPAPADETLAQSLGFSDIEALRRQVREQLQRNYAQASRARLKRQLLDKLAEAHDFPVPPGLVDAEFQSIWQRLQAELKEGGAAAEDAGRPEEELRAEYQGIAERRVRLGLLLAEVGRRNNIQVGRDEINRAMVAEARRYPGHEREIMEYFRKQPEAADRLRAPLFEEKAVDFILELAQVTDRTVTPEELAALDRDGVDSEGQTENIKA